jgi:hypothetical protein
MSKFFFVKCQRSLEFKDSFIIKMGVLCFFLSLLWARTPAYYVVDTKGKVLCAHDERAQVYPESLRTHLLHQATA